MKTDIHKDLKLYIAWAFCLCLSLAVFVSLTSNVSAQTPQATPNAAAQNTGAAANPVTIGSLINAGLVANATAAQEETDPEVLKKQPFTDSLFLTQDEISAIQRALLGVDDKSKEEDTGPKPPRILRLSGLLYKSPNDWVIWLNGNRLTPNRLLPEIIEISVESTKIHLKWFDYGINNVIFITLRPHQVYDMETGILLPG